VSKNTAVIPAKRPARKCREREPGPIPPIIAVITPAWGYGSRIFACRGFRRGTLVRDDKVMIRLAAILFTFVLTVMNTAGAQTGDGNWPQRPLRLVAPFPAGSSTDIVARIIAQKLTPRLGVQIVIENRAGASGNIGVDAVAKAPPDGSTIGIATASTHTVAPSLGTHLPYDPIADFSPIGMIGSQPYVLVVFPGVPAKNLAELIALAKAKPGTLNYGSAGVASLAHLATALFANMAGIDILHVPYKSSSQSMTDMITGRLDMQFATIGPSIANIRADQLRALATSGKDRVAVLADVPTVAESGIAGYEAALWIALVAPAGTPRPIVARLNQEVNAILESTEGKEALAAQGLNAEPGPWEAVSERIRADTEKWRGIIAKAGIRPE
jgi:tripartite-type tricarboxylate transporter receptor subunit TctC